VIEPLRIQFEVACTPEHAFEVWTTQTSRWWPSGHSVSGAPVAVLIEPGVGGRIYERTAEGGEIDWGEVTVWDPPRRLGYLWHIRRDRTDATDVVISFLAEGESTRVEIEHRGWERLGAQGEAWRDANRAGWAGLLPHFVSACEAAG